MPKAGRHPSNKLTAVFVRSTKRVGRHCDGNGLYLVVEPSFAKRWIVRLTVKGGARTDMGLGSAQVVTLADAREHALAAKRLARQGLDPVAARRAATIRVPTFKEAAEKVHRERLPTYRNAKHAAQWIQTLRTYAYPEIGDRPVNTIRTTDILAILQTIWLTKPETASRLKQRIVKVIDWAKAHGHITGDNVAATVQEVLPRQSAASGRHAAVPYQQIPAFVRSLSHASGSDAIKLGLELIILTALRTNEVQGGKWSEVNWQEKTWTIPAERQLKKKVPEPHVVPLSSRCIELLTSLRALAGDSVYMFPGSKADKPISNMTFLMALKRLGRNETVHGFRSAFRTWVDEETDFSSDVAERALAHTIKSKVEAAYRRGDFLQKRRELMQAWAGYVSGSAPQADIPQK